MFGNREGQSGFQFPAGLLEAEGMLANLASVFFPSDFIAGQALKAMTGKIKPFNEDEEWPDLAARYRILVEQIPAIVFMAYLDQGISEAYVSPQIEQMLGFTQGEWLRDPVRWFQQIHPEDKVRWSTEAAKMFLTGEALRSVYRVLARDGQVIWFRCEVRMVRHSDGRPWFIHGVGFDITDLKLVEAELRGVNQELRSEIFERQRAEKALVRSEQMLRGIFEFAPDTIVVVNRLGFITKANAQIERMFGYKAEEVINQSVEILLPDTLQKIHERHRQQFLTDPHLRPMGLGLELFGKRKDDSQFPVEIMLSPIEAEGHTLVIAVIRDITRRKKADEALRKSSERQKVLSRRLLEIQESERRRLALELHDEVGQKLTGLKLTLEMSAKLAADEATRASISQAQEIVNDLMAQARRMSLDLRPATLDHLGLLPALLWHMRNYTTQTGIEVDFRHTGIEGKRFEPELETAAYRVVQEALTNVARHAGVTLVSVRIWADKKTFTVQIEDAGKGFDPQTALARADSSGLAGMRERVTLLSGQFTIESSQTQGTRLTAEWNFGNDE
ncbi:MAG: PAS domain S-box protein [Acidobacteria bacterium]|nr:PAS domain S-box protein [Acidobacteriota bacterium]